MNWKLAIDTFGETYHFGTLHRNSLAQDFYGNVQIYDTFERNHRMMLCLKSIDAMRDQPKVSWHVLGAALPVYYIFPNVDHIPDDGLRGHCAGALELAYALLRTDSGT